MKNQYHIFNGDALKEQFPNHIYGEIIVARECFVDGNVKGDDLEELFDARAKFISENYEGYSKKDYYEKTVTEFEKIQNITKGADINLWFEDDLFCQVNFWFVVNLLNIYRKNNSIYLVRPVKNNEYNFGGLSESDLIFIFKNKKKIEPPEYDKLAKLWKFYQQNDFEEMLKIAKELKLKYPFLTPAIKAHIDRVPKKGKLGRPSQTLTRIMNELDTNQFEQIFREFCKRESIYGFGDLQVKRLFNEIIDNR